METCSLHDKAQIEAFLRKNVYLHSQSLTVTADHIGLNVKANNKAALSLYEKLGFEKVSPYYECMISMHC